MAKTKEIEFTGSAGRFDPSTYSLLRVTIEDPNMDELLSEVADEDLIDHVQNNFKPEDIFDSKELEKWAEENGYTKEN